MASSSKRPFPEDTEGDKAEERTSLGPQRKRPRLWPLYSLRIIIFISLQKFLEPLLRRVVQEKVSKVLHNYFRPSPRLTIDQTHESVRFKLQFQNKLAPKLFVGKGIKAEDKTPIQIAIKDAITDACVTSEPWASMNVKLVAVRGDFNPDGRATWSKEEFNSYVQSERDGRRPLLIGELNIRLRNGVGCIGHAAFTDNSRWTWSGKFRLGALVSRAPERVLEAISEAVQVKDARVEPNQKDGAPSLEDTVFCLKKIRKDGPYHQRLKSNNINTVQDFLRSFVVDSGKLRSLLKMANASWEVTTGHALQCNLGNKLFSYHAPEKGIILIFNAIFELVQVKIGGQNHPVNALSISQKKEVNDCKKLAYENSENIHEFRETAVEIVDDASHPAMDIATIPGGILFDPMNFDYPTTFLGASSSHVSFQHQSHALQNAVSSDAFQPGLELLIYTTLPEAGSSSLQGQVPGDIHNLHPTVTESVDVSLTAVAGAVASGPILSEPLNSYHPIMFPDESSSRLELQQEFNPLYSSTTETGSSLLSSSYIHASFSTPGPSSFETPNIQAVHHDIDTAARVASSSPDAISVQCLVGSTNNYNFDDDDENLVLWDWNDILLEFTPPRTEVTTSACPLSPRKWVQLRAALKLVLVKPSTARRATIIHSSHRAMVPSA